LLFEDRLIESSKEEQSYFKDSSSFHSFLNSDSELSLSFLSFSSSSAIRLSAFLKSAISWDDS